MLFLIVAVKSDLPSGDKFSVQFPLPGHVGFAPTQPMLAVTESSEASDSHLKHSSAQQPSSEASRFVLQLGSLKFSKLDLLLRLICGKSFCFLKLLGKCDKKVRKLVHCHRIKYFVNT